MLLTRLPKNTDTLLWTNHVRRKMVFYRLSESRLKRILRNPERSEKGIAPGTIALMQSVSLSLLPPSLSFPRRRESRNPGFRIPSGILGTGKSGMTSKKSSEIWLMYQRVGKKKRMITAWRYPGKSPKRDVIPIPADILEELTTLRNASKTKF